MKPKTLRDEPRVIDSSALIAWFQNEPGDDLTQVQLDFGGMIAAPNLTEVIGKLVSSGVAPINEVRVAPINEVQRDVLALGLEVIPMDETIALASAFFYARRHPYDLSLGDCVCIAVAETLGLEILTAEQSWAKIPDLRVKVRLIR
jgi:PIN domain nuclease of toxin-antitoxin system